MLLSTCFVDDSLNANPNDSIKCVILDAAQFLGELMHLPVTNCKQMHTTNMQQELIRR